MSMEEARALLAAFKGTRWAALNATALTLGLRRGALLGLRWADVDLNAGTLSVRCRVQKHEGEYRFVPPNSKEGRRTLPIPAPLIATLREHRQRQLEERVRLGPTWQDWDLRFRTAVGTPQDGMNVTHRFQERLRKAGLPPMRFHDLRQSAATLLLANGFTLKEI
jgi:integrase